VLKETCAFLVRWSGLPLLVRHTVARRRTSVLVYHDPSPSLLETHLAYLARRYTFVTLTRLVEAIQRQDWSSMPSRSLVVTFDDGHAGNVLLLDAFRRHGLEPTIYLCSGIVGSERHFWFKDARADFDALVGLPQEERVRVLRERFGFDAETEHPGDPQALAAEELSLMSAQVEFGSHTRFHPTLTTCSDEECEQEIAGSKGDLEALLNEPCMHFSYPNGDYTEREIELAKRAGYASARTADIGWNSLDTDPFRLRIVGIADGTSLNMLSAQLSGVRFLRPRARGSIWRRGARGRSAR
jgi:peptidoglycan/xylan/chitin deacetylase (PgdA/CDA1 family)